MRIGEKAYGQFNTQMHLRVDFRAKKTFPTDTLQEF